jgi:hypothetical protein
MAKSQGEAKLKFEGIGILVGNAAATSSNVFWREKDPGQG